MNTGLFLLSGYILNFIFIFYVLFFEKDDSARRFSWLLAIAFVPVAGILLYVLLSGNFFTRTRRMVEATRRADEQYRATIGDQYRELGELRSSGLVPMLDDYGQIVQLNLRYGKSPVLAANTVHVFTSGEEKYRCLFAELRAARETINLSYFIIQNDQTGHELISILREKALAGVSIRLLYDHIGSILTPARLFFPLKRAGGFVNKFYPVSIINPFWVNYRNHRKIVVIDGKIGYFGGMNIGDEYANRNHARKYHWRDTHARVVGPAVQLLQKQFLVDWHASTRKETIETDDGRGRSFFPKNAQTAPREGFHLPENSRTNDVTMQIVAAGPDDMKNDEIRDAMALMILKAKRTVYVETPYFTPDAVFFSALKTAALSGTDVRVIIPGTWDKWYAREAAMTFIGDLVACGVRFFAYPGFIHSKQLVVDGVVSTLGSTNIDARSFSLHFELNAFFYSAEFGAKAAGLFLKDERESTPLTSEWFSRVSIIRKAWWNFMRLFAPLL